MEEQFTVLGLLAHGSLCHTQDPVLLCFAQFYTILLSILHCYALHYTFVPHTEPCLALFCTILRSKYTVSHCSAQFYTNSHCTANYFTLDFTALLSHTQPLFCSHQKTDFQNLIHLPNQASAYLSFNFKKTIVSTV